MQVSGNYQHSPNFGRLEIKAKAAGELRKLPMAAIDKVRKANELLKDTKYYHVVINEDMEARLVSESNPYFGLFRTDEYISQFGRVSRNGKTVKVKNRLVVMNEGGKIFEVEKISNGRKEFSYNLSNAKNKPCEKVNDIDTISHAAKILDDVAILEKKAY